LKKKKEKTNLWGH